MILEKGRAEVGLLSPGNRPTALRPLPSGCGFSWVQGVPFPREPAMEDLSSV